MTDSVLCDRLENTSHGAEVSDITSFGAAGYFVEKSHRLWFETRLGRIVFRIYNIDLNLDRKLDAMNPAFSFFVSIGHKAIKERTL